MQFLYGLLTAVVFFIVLLAVFFTGYKLGKRHKTTKPISDEDKKQMEQFNNHFKKLFTYDVDTALQKKKVT